MVQQISELGEHESRLLADVAVRVTAKLVATRMCFPLAAAVLLPRVPGAVELVAVELDRQAELGPAAGE
jgi:hypothetical protein